MLALAAVTLCRHAAETRLAVRPASCCAGTSYFRTLGKTISPIFRASPSAWTALSTQAVTDKSGAWHIDDVPAGHHDITLHEGDLRHDADLGQDVAGPSTVAPKITMAITPTAQAIIDSIWVNTLSGIAFYFVDGHLSAPPPATRSSSITVLFVSKSESVSAGSRCIRSVEWLARHRRQAIRRLRCSYPSMARVRRLERAHRLFVTGYATSAACSCYTDPVTKNRVFSNTGLAPTSCGSRQVIAVSQFSLR